MAFGGGFPSDESASAVAQAAMAGQGAKVGRPLDLMGKAESRNGAEPGWKGMERLGLVPERWFGSGAQSRLQAGAPEISGTPAGVRCVGERGSGGVAWRAPRLSGNPLGWLASGSSKR